MAALLRMSEATTLGLHAGILVAEAEGPVSAAQMAGTLDASEAHLAKVLQSLTRAGLLRSKRGPKGGYVLARAASEISLLDVYESLEGKLPLTDCLFERKRCDRAQCILGGLIESVRTQIGDYLGSTSLRDAMSSHHPAERS